MVLAEKWNLTLEQPSIPRNNKRRNSYMLNVEPTPASGETHGQQNQEEESKVMAVEIDDNYFQVDQKEVHRNQIIELKNQTTALCDSLPIQKVVESSSIEPDIRWEKTKDWKSGER